MNLNRDRVRVLYMEKDRARFDHLQSELEGKFGSLLKLPVWAEAVRGEAGADAERLLSETGAWGHPILAIFDSWGNVNVPLRLMQRIAANPSSEVIVTFGPNWFNRREKLDPEQLDHVFGGRQFWTPANAEVRTDERWRAWLATFRDALRRAGFRYQLQFKIVPKTNLPLYLVFGTGHPSGVEAMKDAMWKVDGTDGMGFADPRTRDAPLIGQQPLFWAGTDQPELVDLARQCLESGPVSLEQLGHWLLTETSRWRARDARDAVQGLLDAGEVSVTPGRLAKASVVTLR